MIAANCGILMDCKDETPNISNNHEILGSFLDRMSEVLYILAYFHGKTWPLFS